MSHPTVDWREIAIENTALAFMFPHSPIREIKLRFKKAITAPLCFDEVKNLIAVCKQHYEMFMAAMSLVDVKKSPSTVYSRMKVARDILYDDYAPVAGKLMNETLRLFNEWKADTQSLRNRLNGDYLKYANVVDALEESLAEVKDTHEALGKILEQQREMEATMLPFSRDFAAVEHKEHEKEQEKEETVARKRKREEDNEGDGSRKSVKVDDDNDWPELELE